MPYQKPKADHPWRQYKNKRKSKSKDRDDIITVREFLIEIVEHWDTYEITTTSTFEGNNIHPIKILPQSKQAASIAGILRRNYVENL